MSGARRRRLRAALGLAAGMPLGLFAARAAAEAVTFRVTGQVTEVADNVGAVPSVGPGSVYSAEYDFDPETADQNADPALGLFPQPLGTLRADLNGTQIRCPAPNGVELVVSDGSPITQDDGYFASGLGCDALPEAEVEVAELVLIDSSASVFTSDALPATPPDPGAFDVAFFVVAGCPPATAGVCDPPSEGFSVAASVDSIVTVPEPLSGWSRLCVLSTLCALGIARRPRFGPRIRRRPFAGQ